MNEKTAVVVLVEARRHTTGNRSEIEKSSYAGCLSCCAVFDTKDIRSWRDEWKAPEHQKKVQRWSAVCPSCETPNVIGSHTGLLKDPAYLATTRAILAERSMLRL